MYHKQLIRPVIKAWVKHIYNKKPMSLRKGIGFCQQSELCHLVDIVFFINL